MVSINIEDLAAPDGDGKPIMEKTTIPKNDVNITHMVTPELRPAPISFSGGSSLIFISPGSIMRGINNCRAVIMRLVKNVNIIMAGSIR